MVEIFPYRVFDIINDTSIIPEKMATRKFIEASKGEVLEGGLREVDDRLVDGNGQALLGLPSEEAKLLRDLYERGGQGSISGNQDRRAMRNLEVMRLLNHQSVSLDRVDYEITDLGKLAVEHLLK